MAFEVNYGSLDRLLHRIAFAAPSIQRAAADMEKSLFGKAYRALAAKQPVFITSLPRAGTTLVLDLLAGFPSVATQTYRDMPFVMAPMLWSRLSQSFRQRESVRARAHGDGMQVGFDSAEAFEEVFWHMFWPHKYSDKQIALWQSGDADEDARAFFHDHMKKTILLRRPECAAGGRYISKNNGNIARLDFLPRMFDDAIILVPLRDPLQHAASLHRQHLNFTELHRSDRFVRRYMEDIGHFEFGELHRPVSFPGIEGLVGNKDPMTIDYWLAYWIAAFEHIYERRKKLLLLSYEHLCGGGSAAVAALCDRLNLDPGESLDAAAAMLRPPSGAQTAPAGLNTELHQRAVSLHRALLEDCEGVS